MKKVIQNNGIFLVFLFSQLILFFFGMQKSDFIEGFMNGDYNINQALFFHLLIILLVSLGYSIKKIIVIKYSDKSDYNNFFQLKKGFFFFCLVLIVVGVITSILTIGSIVSPVEYLKQLISRDGGIAQIRQESGDGGLGGVFKMLNYCPLAIYLITSSYLNFYTFNENDTKKIKRINGISLIASLIKVLFSLDRLTIMAILLVQIYTNFIKKKINLKFVLIIGCVSSLGIFITASRMSDAGFFDFLVLYCKLSLVNFQKVIDHQTDFAYGLQTLLSPFYFISKFFGFNLDIPAPNAWVWNPAQYFNSYLFMDFSYFSFLLYPFIGYYINYVELKKKHGSKFYTSFYFAFMFTITTFISVPFIRGMEFWVVILICMMVSKFIEKDEIFSIENVKNIVVLK
jgi:hypothetical protein